MNSVKFGITANSNTASSKKDGTIVFKNNGEGNVGEIWLNGVQYGGGGTSGGETKGDIKSSVNVGGIKDTDSFTNKSAFDILKKMLSVDYLPIYHPATLTLSDTTVDQFVDTDVPDYRATDKNGNKTTNLLTGKYTFTKAYIKKGNDVWYSGDPTVTIAYPSTATAGTTVSEKKTIELTVTAAWNSGDSSTDKLPDDLSVVGTQAYEGTTIDDFDTANNIYSNVVTGGNTENGVTKGGVVGPSQSSGSAKAISGTFTVNFWHKFKYSYCDGAADTPGTANQASTLYSSPVSCPSSKLTPNIEGDGKNIYIWVPKSHLAAGKTYKFYIPNATGTAISTTEAGATLVSGINDTVYDVYKLSNKNNGYAFYIRIV